MRRISSMSDDDKKESYENAGYAYKADYITRKHFELTLASLGYNATDIADAERFYRPSPPENDDGDTGG